MQLTHKTHYTTWANNMQIRNKDLETFVTLNNIIMLIAVILQKSHEIAGKGCFVPCPISFNIAPPTECENIDFFWWWDLCGALCRTVCSPFRSRQSGHLCCHQGWFPGAKLLLKQPKTCQYRDGLNAICQSKRRGSSRCKPHCEEVVWLRQAPAPKVQGFPQCVNGPSPGPLLSL